jgi:hypothetical protein
LLPHYLAIGVTKHEFFHSTPKILKAYDKAHTMKIKEQDELMWIMGQYVLSATIFSVEHCLAGKKAKSEYIKEPMLKNIDGEPEEKQGQEEVAVFEMKQRIKLLEKQGLPQSPK